MGVKPCPALPAAFALVAGLRAEARYEDSPKRRRVFEAV